MDERWSLNAWIAHSEALDRQREIALQAALQSAKDAVTKAETAADKRFELLNELRSGVAPKEQLEALEKQVGTLASRMDRAEAADSGANEYRADWRLTTGTVVAIVVAATAFLSLLVGLGVFIVSKGMG